MNNVANLTKHLREVLDRMEDLTAEAQLVLDALETEVGLVGEDGKRVDEK
jgi:hypothetical protein